MLGEAIIKGMAVTARNFFGSYVSAERLTTIQYPEQRQTLNESVRNFPFLVFDGDDAQKGLRCVACQICEKECPPKCIYIVKSKDKRIDYKGQPQFYPAVFDIDISVCMSCQICVEACPFESIKMDQEFELSATDRFAGLVLHKHQLARANVHYRKIHPRGAAESDAALAVEKAKAEAKAKADAEAKSAAARAALAGTAGSVVPPAPATAKAPAPVPPAAPKPAA